MARVSLVYKYLIKYVFWVEGHDPEKVYETVVTVLQKSELKAEDKFWSTHPGSVLLKRPVNSMIIDMEYLGSFYE